jgi:hypothetical protein
VEDPKAAQRYPRPLPTKRKGECGENETKDKKEGRMDFASLVRQSTKRRLGRSKIGSESIGSESIGGDISGSLGPLSSSQVGSSEGNILSFSMQVQVQ